ncbi:hypothetical protein PILCRDRAFT_92523 [Piloderma croceum F 1598]|uniref:Uncharacterized protein n=1 Tax=Piloderma croceum (strain F 1598) TaxID=765440 RepID=A0A0C3AKW2_PILCF|nr:hypothetical protein PILCRDRAFT_92523 [Piloderma croceum F 1598]
MRAWDEYVGYGGVCGGGKVGVLVGHWRCAGYRGVKSKYGSRDTSITAAASRGPYIVGEECLLFRDWTAIEGALAATEAPTAPGTVYRLLTAICRPYAPAVDSAGSGIVSSATWTSGKAKQGHMVSGRGSDEVVERSRIEFHRDVNDYDGYDVDVSTGSIVVVPPFPEVVIASVGLPSILERTPGSVRTKRHRGGRAP